MNVGVVQRVLQFQPRHSAHLVVANDARRRSEKLFSLFNEIDYPDGRIKHVTVVSRECEKARDGCVKCWIVINDDDIFAISVNRFHIDTYFPV
jgi:hypothetical protein